MSHDLYDRGGKPINGETFERLMKDPTYFMLADDRVVLPGQDRPIRIATKWIGLLKTITDPLFVCYIYGDPETDGVEEICSDYEDEALSVHAAAVKRYEDIAAVRRAYLDNGGPETLIGGAL
ncbi:hypothetical protein [Arthrobacter crystallopoietes]|uniref:Uncharacterized protein n=1 Tax=Crystallibacter crystallopoietes TaxID=37928 RepID=A0A1H1BDR1_9MICC|nr:hypothetical protein [Arthrobacter crystallopoietes]AUI51179.1 hypothetical protein AC20117_10565 [Arthrobacter crystallopoietes]SDQ50052.1 hypothetical protein SAMN04489742_1360 [Arthrobacter crystallopoietes]